MRFRREGMWIFLSGWAGVFLLVFVLYSPGVNARPLYAPDKVDDDETQVLLETAVARLDLIRIRQDYTNNRLADIRDDADDIRLQTDSVEGSLSSIDSGVSAANSSLDAIEFDADNIASSASSIDLNTSNTETAVQSLKFNNEVYLSGILSASVPVSDAMVFSSRVVTGTGFLSPTETVVELRQVTTGDNMQSFLLGLILLVNVVTGLISITRGVSPS